MLTKIDIEGNPYVGVYCQANEDFALVPKNLSEKTVKQLESALDVEVIRTTIAGSSLIGVLAAINSYGIVVSNFADENELEPLKDRVNILYISDVLNAVGNNILVNDKLALVNPDYKKDTIKHIADTFNVEVMRCNVAGIKTVGSVAVVTNKGLLCHPHTSKNELKRLEQLFGLDAAIGTANYGSSLVGACLVANTKGAIVGSITTPIELGRIEDALGL